MASDVDINTEDLEQTGIHHEQPGPPSPPNTGQTAERLLREIDSFRKSFLSRAITLYLFPAV